MRNSPTVNEELPNIHLDNFEDPQFENCRYVLTSPKSLEVCAKLNIRPVDLLHKCKEEFIEEFKNLSSQQLNELYAKHEYIRKTKVARARAERNKLLENHVFAVSIPDNKQTLLDAAPTYRVCDFGQKAQSRDTIRRSASLEAPTRNTAISRSFSEEFECLLKKLPPNEAKRLRLAHLRCLQCASAASPQFTGGDINVTGKRSVPFANRSCDRPADNHSSQVFKLHNGQPRRCTSSRSIAKEKEFWFRKHTMENDRIEEIDKLRNSLDDRELRVEEVLEKNARERHRHLVASHLEREKRIQQAQERRRRLETMLEDYRRELYEAREASQQRARERVLRKLNEEIQRKAQERMHREQHIRENARQVQQKQEEWRRMAEAAQKQKDSYIQKLLEEREAKIRQSRGLAQATEQLREEMLRIYNLDSFDKKVQRVTILNEIGLGNPR